MKLRARLLLTAIGVAVPVWLVLLGGFRIVRERRLDAALTAAASAAFAGSRCSVGVTKSITVKWDWGSPLFKSLSSHQFLIIGLDSTGRSDSGTARISAAMITTVKLDGVGVRTYGTTRQVAVAITYDSACGFTLAESAVNDTTGAPPPLLLWPVLVAVLGVLAGLGPIVRRARLLTEGIRRWQIDSGAPIPIDRGSDELGKLARAYHSSVQTLMKREEALKEFIEDTTHDLATPLTVLRGHLWGLKKDFESPRLESAAEEVDFIVSVVANLPLKAKLSVGFVSRSDIDVNQIMSRVHDRFYALAAARNLRFEAAWPAQAVKVHADPTCLEQAINNLVENAIRHHEPPGHIALVLDASSGAFSIRVEDDGPGIGEADLQRVLVRGEGGRAGGSGLGLAIVDQVAVAHGWQFSIRAGDSGGLVAELKGIVG